MKKFVLYLMLAFIWSPDLLAQRVINNPAYEFRSTGRYRVGQFILSDTATKMQLINEYIPGWYIAFNQKSIHLENPKTGEKYYARSADNFEWDEHLTTPSCGVDTFYFTFPPLPKGLASVDCIDDIRGIYGISLLPSEKKEKKKDIYELLDGNWLSTDGTNRWTYGFYKNFAIANSQFWEYESVEKKGKNWLMNLKSEGQRCQLWIKPEKNGMCRIGKDLQNMVVFRPDGGELELEAENSSGEVRCVSGGKAHIQGYFRGFDPRATILNSGTIYISNVVTREDYPVTIDMQADGRFAFDLEMEYPCVNSMRITNSGSGLRFYAEPGDTLTICIDWEDWLQTDRFRDRVFTDFRTIRYMGAHSKVNADLTKSWPYFSNSALSCGTDEQKYVRFTPVAYKEFTLAYCKTRLALLDSLSERLHFSPKSIRVLKADLMGRTAADLIDFANDRGQEYYQKDMPESIKNSLVPEDYYDFLQQMPLNDPCMLAPVASWIFFNRFEFAAPFRVDMEGMASGPEKYVMELWQRRDSVYRNILKLSSSICYEVIKVRSLSYFLPSVPHQLVDSVVWTVLPSVKNPYLRGKVMELRDMYASERMASSPIPEGKGTEIFQKLIAPYAGKVVFVDFWATFCGPCLAGIKHMAPMREKYQGKEVVFLFITSEKQSPLQDYNRIMAEVKGEKVRISEKDFNYLQELFRFNGIPYYLLLNRKGELVNPRYYGEVEGEALIDKVLEEK